MGVDAICWESQDDKDGLTLPNPLIEDFVVSMSGVKLLRRCPSGNNISGVAPKELVVDGERLRTTVGYNFTVSLDINVTSLNASDGFTSDHGPGIIAVQVLNCLVGASGFCSPFIHEEANARLAAAAAAAQAANPNVKLPEATPRPRGAMHGDSHVHSGYKMVNLPFSEGPIYKNVEVKVPMYVLTPGTYFSVVSAQLYFYTSSNTTKTVDDFTQDQQSRLLRYDMANALFGDQRLLTYQAPAVVLEVPSHALYFSYVLIGISSCVISFLLVQTIKHRNHQVMKLSQGTFLVVFLFFSLAATVTSFLLEPKNDFYCNASVFFVGISLQFVYAVTVGRLWRIHALINPMLLKTFAPESTPWTRFVDKLHDWFSCMCSCCFRDKKRRKLRTQVNDTQLWIVIAVLVAPQIAIQIVAVIVQPQSRTVDLNADESRGRAICSAEDANSLLLSVIFYGFIIFCLLVMTLLIMAFKSRKLPSLFNESKIIFDSSLTSSIILIMGVAVIAVTREPTTSPAVTYLIVVFVVLSMTVNTSLRIVLPKLLMVWRGETVVVSKLVMDHTRKMRDTRMGSVSGVSGSAESAYCDFDGTSSHPHSELHRSGGPYSNKDSDGEHASTFEMPRKRQSSSIHFETEDITESFNEPQTASASEPLTAPVRRMAGSLMSMPDLNSIKSNTNGTKRKAPRGGEILIETGKAPSRRLTLKMIDMQSQLDRITHKIMSGLVVTQDDWEETRRLAGKFGSIFTSEVAFSWEQHSGVNDNFVDDAGAAVPAGDQVIQSTIDEEEDDEDETEEASKDPEFISQILDI
ncbi:hypothetical protein ACA910_006944 [Epithemia clementina (nom. ined.)]